MDETGEGSEGGVGWMPEQGPDEKMWQGETGEREGKEREMEVKKGGRAVREENLELSTSAVARRAEWWSMLAAL